MDNSLMGGSSDEMENHDNILIQQLGEQIALEENLFRVIEEQISEIDQVEFSDARDLLIKAGQTLEQHFTPLNALLDTLEKESPNAKESNGRENHKTLVGEQKKSSLSRILRDDYSALTLITIGNTLLHTTALALKSAEVATTSLRHLENLAPIVIKIGEIMPEIVARELCTSSTSIDPSVGQTALMNTKRAWRLTS